MIGIGGASRVGGWVRVVQFYEGAEAQHFALEPPPYGAGWLERSQVWPLLQAYRRCLRAIIVVAQKWMSEQILSTIQEIGSNRPAVWLSEN